MLSLKSLLARLIYGFGTEPRISVNGSLSDSSLSGGGHIGALTTITTNSEYLHNGRIGCGMSADGTTIWFINHLSKDKRILNQGTFNYSQYFLVEVFSTKAFSTGDTRNGYTGGTYYGYTEYADMSTADKQPFLVLDTIPSNLTSGIPTSTWSLLCRGSWGSYCNSSATSQINIQACSTNTQPGKIVTHSRNIQQTSSYTAFIYGVSLWGLRII